MGEPEKLRIIDRDPAKYYNSRYGTMWRSFSLRNCSSSPVSVNEVREAAGEEPEIDLPGVRQNLQDHTRIVNTYRLRYNYTTPDILQFNQIFDA